MPPSSTSKTNVSMHRYPSPLRYPGGKAKIANFVKLLLIQNELIGCTYVEPFAGGAGVALALLYEDLVDTVHINDVNRSVWAFWKAALEHTDGLCARIENADVTVEEWKRQREIAKDEQASALDAGFAAFFLNRTSRSGIIGGGVIGGLDQQGKWKIDARFNRGHLVERVLRVGDLAERITLTRHDAAAYLRDVLPSLEGEILAYIDPPYFSTGRRLYQDSYEAEDHEEIAGLVRSLESPWLVSYDTAQEIVDLYDGERELVYDLNYSAGDDHGRGEEVMFLSADLAWPDAPSPAGLKRVDVTRALRAAATP